MMYVKQQHNPGATEGEREMVALCSRFLHHGDVSAKLQLAHAATAEAALAAAAVVAVPQCMKKLPGGSKKTVCLLSVKREICD